MATTSRASCKRLEDVEIFQMLEESTDSDVTVFSSEEDEDGNETDSDEDGLLDENSETNENGALVLEAQKLLICSGLLPYIARNYKNMKIYQVPNILYQLAAVRKTFLSYFSTMIFTTKLRKKQINMQLFHKETREQWVTTGKTLMREKFKPILEF